MGTVGRLDTETGLTRVIIPTLNEAQSITMVLEEVRQAMPSALVTVVDGQSTDQTREIARQMGIPIIVQEGSGKGAAIAQALSIIDYDDEDIIVMMDGDYTYSGTDAKRLVEDITSNNHDIAAGSRLHGHREPGSLTRLNVIGNRILTRLAGGLISQDVKDLCTGLWAFRGKVVRELSLSQGFDLEASIFAGACEKGMRISWVPINYRNRRFGKPKLGAMKDGFRIAKYLASRCRDT